MTDYISEKQAAAIILKSESWLRAKRLAGVGPRVAAKAGRTPLYLASDVRAWAEGHDNAEEAAK